MYLTAGVHAGQHYFNMIDMRRSTLLQKNPNPVRLDFSKSELWSFTLIASDPSSSIEAWLVDVGRQRAAGQVRQVQSTGEGNQARRHLQDGQQPLAGIHNALCCLQAKQDTDPCEKKGFQHKIPAFIDSLWPLDLPKT